MTDSAADLLFYDVNIFTEFNQIVKEEFSNVSLEFKNFL